MTGWRCPGCQRCWAPDVVACRECGPAARPRCAHYFGTHDRRCTYADGHDGPHRFNVGDKCPHGRVGACGYCANRIAHAVAEDALADKIARARIARIEGNPLAGAKWHTFSAGPDGLEIDGETDARPPWVKPVIRRL